MNLVIIGTTYVDIKGYPEGAFISDGRNSGTIRYVDGGVGRNVAEDIANCGLHPTFVSIADHSPLSRDTLLHLNEAGMNTSYIEETENGLGTWMAIFNEAGDVVSSISKRPDLSGITRILEQKGDAIISEADRILIEMDMDLPILEKTFALAEKYHKEVYGLISNMSIALEHMQYVRKTACFVCNQQETGMLLNTDLKQYSADETIQILRRQFPALGMKRLVVTLGSEGAVFAEAGETPVYGQVGCHDIPVVDTTGAGDAFFSGVSIGLACSKTLKEACEIGTALSESVIQSRKNVCRIFTPEELGISASV